MMRWAWPVLPLFLTGCQCVGIANQVTPQIQGRVLSATTCEPIAGVNVRPALPGQTPLEDDLEKGAQRLVRGRPVVTDSEGRFVFPSRDYVRLLKRENWWSLKLSFQRSGYAAIQTNFTATIAAAHTAEKAPIVNAGDIYLQPLTQ